MVDLSSGNRGSFMEKGIIVHYVLENSLYYYASIAVVVIN
jgi:hypothetical protein